MRWPFQLPKDKEREGVLLKTNLYAVIQYWVYVQVHIDLVVKPGESRIEQRHQACKPVGLPNLNEVTVE